MASWKLARLGPPRAMLSYLSSFSRALSSALVASYCQMFASSSSFFRYFVLPVVALFSIRVNTS
jgi:hypothetical protein